MRSITLLASFILLFAGAAKAEMRLEQAIVSGHKGPFTYQLQGLCHDENSIFVVQRYRVWKIPREKAGAMKELRSRELLSAGIPKSLALKGFDHIGDCDVVGQRLLLPIDGGKQAKILILDSRSLEVMASPDLPRSRKGVSWVTHDERDDTLLVGDFNFTAGKPQIQRVKLSTDLRTMTDVEQFALLQSDGSAIDISRVQAAEVDGRNRILYLLSDVRDGGVLEFDLTNRRLLDHLPIAFNPPIDELEGLDLIDGALSVLMIHKVLFGIDGRLHLMRIAQ